MAKKRFLFLWSVVFIVALAEPLMAGEFGQAIALFNEGQQLFNHSDFRKAIEKWEAALKEAKNYLRNNGYDNPFYWAPFILMGETNWGVIASEARQSLINKKIASSLYSSQ
ncbi:MAG: hypothetical protein EPN22_13980 [Nitrospirae bacterium]|nr:MAG: hypothetical protein EPN22_13980 [Nitrospirota bacterium]